MTSSARADAAGGERAAYVHVPFCARLCPYCDFNVVAGRDELIDRYVDAVVAEIRATDQWGSLDSVYVGGGTPTRIPPQRLGDIIRALDHRFGLSPGAEVSLEANPEDWTPDLGNALRGVGFTRVSFGAQSFDSDTLRALGRLHDPGQGREAVIEAVAQGFSVNIDLIFGTPGETLDEWKRTVETAMLLRPHHLSVYALTVERGTALSRAINAGAPAPDEDLQADEYEAADHLAGAMLRYEVSNYAVEGHECVYNLITWAQGEYLGIGAGAHGHRDGARTRNVRRVDAYVDRVERGVKPRQGVEVLDPWKKEQERLLLGLRRTVGVATGRGGRLLLDSEAGARLVDAGVIEERSGRIIVLRPLLTDEVSRSVLALSG